MMDQTSHDTTSKSIEAAVKAGREACVKVCEELIDTRLRFFDMAYREGFSDGADACAEAIRERGEK